MDILVISDSHIDPRRSCVNLWRDLAKYVQEKQPKYIVHLGDVACLDSQAHYIADRGDYKLEEEVECVALHLKAFEKYLSDARNKARADHKKIYKPIKILCLGNHDIRKDVTVIEELFTEFGWIVAGYQDPVKIGDILFAHCLPRMNTDITCVSPDELLSNWHSSVVVGHSHVQGYAEGFNLIDDKIIRAIKCPCFTSKPPTYGKLGACVWPLGFLEITLDPFEFTWRNIACLTPKTC